MKSNFTTFYIVRHGETDLNAKRLLGGQTEPNNLTEKGKEQARLRGKEFKNIHFSAVFASDLLRAKHTAEIITLEKKLAVETTEVLRERHYGVLESRMGDQKENIKKMVDTIAKLSHDELRRYKFDEQMENDEELMARFMPFLREVAVAYGGKNVLVVCHGGLMRAFLIHIGFGTYDDLPRGSVKNTGYIKLHSDGTDFFIDKVVDITKMESSEKI